MISARSCSQACGTRTPVGRSDPIFLTSNSLLLLTVLEELDRYVERELGAAAWPRSTSRALKAPALSPQGAPPRARRRPRLGFQREIGSPPDSIIP